MGTEEYDRLIAQSNVYSAILYCIAFFTLCFSPFHLFCMWTRTPSEMRIFQWIFMNSCGSSMIMTVLITVAQPIHVPPFAGCFSYGILGYLGPNSYFIVLSVAGAVCGNMIFVYSVGFVHNYHLMVPMAGKSRFGLLTKFSIWLETDNNILKLFLFIAINTIVYTFLFIYWIAQSMERIGRESPQMTELTKALMDNQQSAMIMPIDAPALRLWVYCCTSMFMGAIFLIISINFLILRSIRSTKSIVSKSTLKRQKLVYRVMVIKSLAILLGFFIPLTLLLKEFVCGVTDSRHSMLYFIIINSLCLGQGIMTVFNVRQYRVWFFRLAGLFSSEKSTETVSSG